MPPRRVLPRATLHAWHPLNRSPPNTSGRDNDTTWLSTRQAADQLGITPRTLYRLIDTDGLPAYQVGRVIRLRDDDVTRWLQSRRIRPGDLSHLYPPGDATP